MSRAIKVVHMTLRISGLLLVLLGIAIWTARADQIIPLHEVLGFVLVLSLWTLAFFAARAGVSMGWVALAVVWGLIAPVIGLAQDRLLTGEWHWTIQILHVLIGLGAIAQGEGLVMRMRRRVSSREVRAA